MLVRQLKIIGLIACDPQGHIGNKGKTPWFYQDELAYFRRVTEHQIMIMGRKTFEAIPESTLKDRFNIVFTRQNIDSHRTQDNVVFVSSLEDFLSLNMSPVYKTAYMIGGAEIAELFLREGLISEFLITKINKVYEGDTFFSLKFLNNWPYELFHSGNDYSIYHYTNPQKL